MPLERYLDPLESSILMECSEPVCSVEYEGKIDAEVLRKAYRILSLRHPVLCADIRQSDLGYVLYVPAGKDPSFMALSGAELSSLDKIRYPNRICDGLSRLILAQDNSGGQLALQMNHCVADARSMTTILTELWQLYGSLIGGSAPSVGPVGSLPQSPYELIRRRWNDEFEPQMSGGASKETGTIEDPPIQSRIRLGYEETTNLVDAARMLKITVHPLVCAAIAIALRANSDNAAPHSMICDSTVDLRSRMSPPVKATEAANVAFDYAIKIDVSQNSDPVVVSNEIRRKLELLIAGRRAFNEEPDSTRNVNEYLDRFGVTNPGVIPPLPRLAGLNIVDFTWLISMPPRARTINSGYIVYTYDRRLTIEGIFPSPQFSSQDVNTIVKRYLHELRQISGLYRED
ncbi:phthiocerol/phthiodiolone dimycocerosyl transferase family protein [Phytoactinopolyspora endophytica]|uniref:phthiocerol/phthiodiolone dimycocerosyl transferase family protein n=1 Tax=Phytoactinopolyspora endophytica TaxID=1642495 RepID=UPI00101B5B17|nr:hypothetical protein [Phytoactinopolyspora endophytica]